MIKIPTITTKELEIFRNKKIILYGIRNSIIQLYKIFDSMNMTVIVYCDNKKIFLECKVRKMNTIVDNQLSDFIVKNNKNIILQDTGNNPDLTKLMKLKSKQYELQTSEIAAGKIIASYSYMPFFQSYKNPIVYRGEKLIWKYACNLKDSGELKKFRNKQSINPVVLCMAPKMGDTSLENTFRILEEYINFVKIHHKPRYIKSFFDQSNVKKIKIITGVRDPIAQNLSMFYQMISTSIIDSNWLLGMLENKTQQDRIVQIDIYENLCINMTDDVGIMWEEYINRYIYPKNNEKLSSTMSYSIQQFLPEFYQYTTDLSKYPFDKKRGFGIIKIKNTEIFIYQLEKLNNLIPELSKWLGVPFQQLENANIGSEKWIGDSYKQALEEIMISQEYFEKCYNEEYVKHFYSVEDIQRFKERWKCHVINAD